MIVEKQVPLQPHNTFGIVARALHLARIRTEADIAALRADPHLANGLNVHAGQVTYEAVARELGYAYVPVAEVL